MPISAGVGVEADAGKEEGVDGVGETAADCAAEEPMVLEEEKLFSATNPPTTSTPNKSNPIKSDNPLPIRLLHRFFFDCGSFYKGMKHPKNPIQSGWPGLQISWRRINVQGDAPGKPAEYAFYLAKQ